MTKPRKPNQEEIDELIKYLLIGKLPEYPRVDREEVEEAKGLVEKAYVAVFDDYITDSPGYAGKLMTVVWPGCPSLYEVFIWSDGKMVYLNQSEGFRREENGGE